MRPEDMAPPSNVFDRSIKLIFQDLPAAACRLAGAGADPSEITRYDTAVNVPELRTDHLFYIKRPGKRPWALQLEYQLTPDRGQLRGWIMKNAALNHQLGIPVVLVVIYLRRGGRKQFPDSYLIRGEGLQNLHRFETVKLWEHRERILNGDLKELAPLLVLCEDKPSEETLRQERRMIRELPIDPNKKRSLLGLAAMLGARFFPDELLRDVFREDLDVLKELSFVDEWLAEREARGEAAGRTAEARQLALRALRAKYHDLPESLVTQLENADPAWCEKLVIGVITAETLQDLLAQHPAPRGDSGA